MAGAPRLIHSVQDDFEDIDEVVARDERDARLAEYLAKARQRLLERAPDRITALAALRLRRGWSQSRLASEVGTCASHVAALEIGDGEIPTDTARRLAVALEVPLSAILSPQTEGGPLDSNQ